MKKTYSSPRLTEYGTVNELTHLFGNPGAGDLGFDASGNPIPDSGGAGSQDGNV
jgi:hypothetical protein